MSAAALLAALYQDPIGTIGIPPAAELESDPARFAGQSAGRRRLPLRFAARQLEMGADVPQPGLFLGEVHIQRQGVEVAKVAARQADVLSR